MPTIGQPAPQFTSNAVDGKGEFKEVNLSDYRGQYVVLFFYPLDFTFVCPTEILQFRDSLKEFQSLNAQVIGASVDSVHSHRQWIQKDLGELGFPLLGDLTKQVCRDYSVLLQEEGFATRGTFIIDPEGIIQYICHHNLSVGRNTQEILRVLEALTTGELCGAGWRKGTPFVKA